MPINISIKLRNSSRFWFIAFMMNILFCFTVSYASEHNNDYQELANETEERSIATGFFVTDTGYIVTAYHVIANYKNINVLVDKRRLLKAEIIKTGTGLDVDYALTHSCYSPDNHGRHCGQCDACLLRRRGFEQAKVTDPTLYAI